MEGLVPTFDMNGNNNGWGSGWGALVGGAVGGAVGSAWGRNGRWDEGGSNQYVMDSLTTMRSDINAIGRDNLMQTANMQSTMCQGFGGVNATVERSALGQQMVATQGFAGLNTAILTGSMQNQLAAKDGVIASIAASNAAEIQGLRNTFDIVSSQKDCCCQTNANIERQGCETRNALHLEGEATRALVAQQEKDRLLRELCDRNARIAQLESQNFNSALANNTQQQNRADLQNVLNTLMARIGQLDTTTTTATTTA